MATTLSPSGLSKPQTGDRVTWWTNLLALWDFVNDLAGKNIAKGTQTISSASWGSISNGQYTQSITMPTGYTFDAALMQFKDSSGNQVYPTVVRTGASTYDITVSNNSLTLTAKYV